MPGFQDGPRDSRNGEEVLTMPTLFVQIIWFMLNPCFPSGTLEFSYTPPDRSCLSGQLPGKTLVAESLMRVPGNISNVLEQLLAGN